MTNIPFFIFFTLKNFCREKKKLLRFCNDTFMILLLVFVQVSVFRLRYEIIIPNPVSLGMIRK